MGRSRARSLGTGRGARARARRRGGDGRPRRRRCAASRRRGLRARLPRRRQGGGLGEPEDFERLNVRGTQNVIDACREAGVRRLVHVGTEAALMVGQPLINVDESAPLRPDSAALYSSSKAKAEQLVRAANERTRDGCGAASLRLGPRRHLAAPRSSRWSRSGRFRWIGGGRQLTATTHVDNTVEGLWLGATKAPAGSVYFVTDGEPVVFREFLTAMLAPRASRCPTSRCRPAWPRSPPPRASGSRACSSGRARHRSLGSRSGSHRRSARSTSPAPSASSAIGL